MPHNIFLHSSIIQTRAYARNTAGKHLAITFGRIDSTISLSLAFYINAAILILAAAAFHYGPNQKRDVAYLSDAYQLLESSVGSAAKIIFGVALLASGQNSAITGTLAGQVVMEGFIQIRLRPWVRRLFTRCITIVPAAVVAGVYGNTGAGKLLVPSQVILSLTLSFAVVPLAHFTGDKVKMGVFVNRWYVKVIAWMLALVIAGLNSFLVIQSIRDNRFGGSAAV